MSTRKEKIGPETAKRLLAMNTRNRAKKENRITYYKEEMLAGRWRFNGDAIRISKTGVILDGQNRLHAIVLSGVTIETLVVDDLDDDVMATIDGGAPRSAGDVLHLAGHGNSRSLAAALSFIHDYFTTNISAKHGVGNSRVLNLLREYPGAEESVRLVGSGRSVLPNAMLSGLHYLFSQVDRAEADRFVRDLTTGSGLSSSDAVYLLRERLLKNAISKARLKRDELAALAIKAWNLRVSGANVRCLKWRGDGEKAERFHVIWGMRIAKAAE